MWLIVNFLSNKSVFKTKNIEWQGIRFRVKALYSKEGSEILSGVCRSSATKFSFFTRSCQIYILVEVSEEMYKFDEDGFVNYEKCLAFLKSYFERCAK